MGVLLSDTVLQNATNQLQAKVSSRRYSANTTSSTSDTQETTQTQTTTTQDNSIFADVGSGNTCTDGNDDGKIGLFSAIGNIAQGVVRGAANMVKGMVFDSDGNISLGNIAKTVGLGALCVACPAAGLVACGIGAATGALKVVNGVSTALNADTDAEAKAAWENVGSGGLTVGLSVVGAKASYNAVQASAGGANSAISSLAKSEGTEGFFATLKANPTGTIKALATDMWSSTKNNFDKIKNFRTYKQTANEVTENSVTKESALKEGFDEQISEGEITNIEEAKTWAKQNGYSESDLETLDAYKGLKGETVQETPTVKQAKADVKTAKEVLKKAQKVTKGAENDPAVKAAQNSLENAKATLKTAKGNTTFGKLTSSAAKVTSKFKVSDVVEYIKHPIQSTTSLIESIPTKYHNIINALENSEYNSVVQKYGEANVLEALEVVAGTMNTDDNV